MNQVFTADILKNKPDDGAQEQFLDYFAGGLAILAEHEQVHLRHQSIHDLILEII